MNLFSSTEPDGLNVSAVKKRRHFLKLLSVTGFATATYSYFRGVRIPPLIWEPNSLPTRFSIDKAAFHTSGVIQTKAQVIRAADISFRAFTPEPTIEVRTIDHSALRISVNNIAQDAVLILNQEGEDSVSESIDGITRTIDISTIASKPIILHWQLVNLKEYRFAAIGDTGGDQELDWCIRRANALGARFLLHLGDINYLANDYPSAIKLFNNAPIPCYVSIGNHDFHDSGPQYKYFTDDIGPLNQQFILGKTRFVNFDTASNTLPYSAGNRGQLFEELITDQNQINTIAFTHRPLFDPRESESHDMGSAGERDWLINNLRRANVTTLLSGHIHIFARDTIKGIDNIIVGQGLSHQDLLTNSNFSKMAIGNVGESGDVRFEFLPLSMPMEMHCHPRTDEVKQSITDPAHTATLTKIEAACAKAN